jgi:outer membrane protein
MKSLIKCAGSICFALSFIALSGIQQPAKGEIPTAATSKIEEKHLLHLTLQDCIEIAFQKSVMRAVSRESIRIAEAQHGQALSARWPQLKLSMTAMRWDEASNFIFPSQPIPLGAAAQPFSEAIANAQLAKLGITPDSAGLAAYNSILATATAEAVKQLDKSNIPEVDVKLMDRDLLSSTFSLVYPLYVGGKISALTKQAKMGVEVSREEARRADLQIVKDIKQYYYGHVMAKKIHDLGRETLERFEATEALTESLFQNGSGKVKKTDYLRTKMMTAALRSVIELMKSGEELSKSALANTMGLAWTTRIGVAEGDIPFHPLSGNLDELVDKARQTNPQMMQVRLGLEAREAKVKEANSGHLPIVAFFGDYTRLDNAYNGGMMTDVNRKSWRVGLSLELPIFNGFRAVSEVREARHRLEKLKKESLLLNEGLALMVKNAFLQIARSQGQVKSLKEAVAMATENRELNERAYQQEMVETKDVIEAQLMEFVMHGQYLTALYEYQTNTGELEFIIGKSIYENQ